MYLSLLHSPTLMWTSDRLSCFVHNGGMLYRMGWDPTDTEHYCKQWRATSIRGVVHKRSSDLHFTNAKNLSNVSFLPDICMFELTFGEETAVWQLFYFSEMQPCRMCPSLKDVTRNTSSVCSLFQYAHRLAFQVGQNLKKDPSIKLCDRLFYL